MNVTKGLLVLETLRLATPAERDEIAKAIRTSNELREVHDTLRGKSVSQETDDLLAEILTDFMANVFSGTRESEHSLVTLYRDLHEALEPLSDSISLDFATALSLLWKDPHSAPDGRLINATRTLARREWRLLIRTLPQKEKGPTSDRRERLEAFHKKWASL